MFDILYKGIASFLWSARGSSWPRDYLQNNAQMSRITQRYKETFQTRSGFKYFQILQPVLENVNVFFF